MPYTNYITIAIDPFLGWIAIAYWLPIDCLSIADRYGPGPYRSAIDRQSIGSRSAIDRLELFTPRRDNSKGNIIALFNTKWVHQLVSIHTNAIFMNRDCVFYKGYPQSPLGAFQACRMCFISFLKSNMPFWKRSVAFNIYQCHVFLHIVQNIKYTRNASPCRKVVEFRPGLSSRPGWWPKRCPIFVNIGWYLAYLVLCLRGDRQ